MALIALVTANRVSVVQSIEQYTLPAAEAIVAGAPIRLDTTTGNWTNSNGTTAPEARVLAVATKTVAAGEALTGICKGVMDGFNLDSQAYDLPIFVSDTDGRLGDAAGTVSTVLGRVIPGTAHTIAVGHDKLLRVNL